MERKQEHKLQYIKEHGKQCGTDGKVSELRMWEKSIFADTVCNKVSDVCITFYYRQKGVNEDQKEYTKITDLNERQPMFYSLCITCDTERIFFLFYFLYQSVSNRENQRWHFCKIKTMREKKEWMKWHTHTREKQKEKWFCIDLRHFIWQHRKLNVLPCWTW